MCRKSGCKTRPHFNIEGQTIALYCSPHKLEGMVNVKNKTCIHPGCKIIPVYNTEGETKGLYCASHKKEGMVNVISKPCNFPGCNIRPIFNIEGETKGFYCSEHKLEGMVNVISKPCNFPDCNIRPAFNIEGETNALYCASHKLEGMVNVISKTCIHPDCKIIPTYNIEGETKGLYCSSHKLEGMVDVKNKTCIHPDCKKQPIYNIEGEPNALYCSAHKSEGMVNVISKTCNNEWCPTYVQDKYEGYCLRCFMYMFPDKPVTRNYKTKEFAVVEHIKTKYPEFTWIADKKVQDGCSMKRPDLLLDLGYQIINLEVDENQHKTSGYNCENKRIMQLSQDLGHRPIVFIRFNPDNFNKQGENITSCWGINKKGICVVKKSKKDEWTQRLTALETQIDYWVKPENKTDKTIEIIQLFYDI